MKTLLNVALIALIAVGLIFGGFYLYGPCGTKVVAQSVSEFEMADSKFVKEFEAASLLSRVSLSGPISNLQEVKRTTGQIKIPACLGPAKTIYLKGMQEGIDGLSAFSRKKADSVVNGHVNSSRLLLDYAASELITISKCTPFCKTNREPEIPEIEQATYISVCQEGNTGCEPATSSHAPFSTRHLLTSPTNRAYLSPSLRLR